MKRLSDDYYHRKCYFEREQVPTQTVMKDKMCTSLAEIYFKSMNHKLKILAGLEPPLVGGGSEWYMPPTELLTGRAVLKPVKKNHIKYLGYIGITEYGEKVMRNYKKSLADQKKQALLDSDANWKKTIIENCVKFYEEFAKEESQKNTRKIEELLEEFERLYRISVSKIETIVLESARAEIERIRKEVYEHMCDRYAELVKCQAISLYDEYAAKLEKKKAEMKEDFKNKIEVIRSEMGQQYHDIKADKHLAVEKLRHFLECQTLACQVYVALKEREECRKEIELEKHIHQKKVATLRQEITLQDFEIRVQTEQYWKRQEFNRIWKQKICHLVKKFQIFVELCLKTLPDYADFFIDMEKLMMIQLNEALETPDAESIFEEAEDRMATPIPRPHPFYLCCDKGYKPQLDQKFCPKHCTSSATQMPVIVVNKRCVYSACDNFDIFYDQLVPYLAGERGNELDIKDTHNYELSYPVKSTHSTQLQELNLESSLMQIVQKELPNTRNLDIDCTVCKIPYCFCSPLRSSKMNLGLEKTVEKKEPKVEPASLSSGNLITTRSSELRLHREPKWDSYMDYVKPKRCQCAKIAKKHLEEHLPVYMRKMSPFEPPQLPNYETCKLSDFKKMVRKSRGIPSPGPSVGKAESKTRDVSTQYSDQEFDLACTCYSADELNKFFAELRIHKTVHKQPTETTQCEVVDGSVTTSYVDRTASNFAINRAYSLRKLMDDDSELQEIFVKRDCNFET